jgi:hypothetical protein
VQRVRNHSDELSIKEHLMEDKKVAVFGIYSDATQAERGVDALVTQGSFSNSDVSVLMPDRQSSKDFAHEKHTKAPEGTTTGAVTGGTIGGTLGLLAGIGALAIPGLGRLSRLVPSWRRSPAWASAARSVAWLALWSGWVFPSTKRSAMKVA